MKGVRLASLLIALCAVLATGCGGASRSETAEPGEPDCIAEWNVAGNADRQVEIVESGGFVVARVGEWFESEERGCSFLLHGDTRFRSFRPSWRDGELDWGERRKLEGTWGTQNDPTHDNAFVLDDGRLEPLAEATGGWSSPECQDIGRSGATRYELCFRGSAGMHGVFVADDGGSRELLTVAPPAVPPGQPLVGHWRWAALSPDATTFLAEWSAECEVPFAFFLPVDGGTPQPAWSGRRWFEGKSLTALGWTVGGQAIGRSQGCGLDQPELFLLDPDGTRETLSCSGASLEPSLEPRSREELCRPSEGLPPSIARVCATGAAEPPCCPGAVVGGSYPHVLYTHCGVESTVFDGRRWLARPRLDNGFRSPPGWDDPVQNGTIHLLGADEAEFQAGSLVARFRRAPSGYEPEACD